MPAFNLFAALAVVLSSRVAGVVDDARRVTLAGSHPAMAGADLGPMPKAARLRGVNLVFGRTAAQEADLAALIAAQHDPASPLHHRWLTPQQFSERFGAADSDIAAAESWLRSHGLNVEDASPTRIRFNGTVAQLQAAFGTELHLYEGSRFAPSSDATIPAALGDLVRGVSNLSSLRPRSHLKPAFTSGQSGRHFLTPADVATIYDVTPVYAAGFDGAGQSIAVIGQSAIVLSDIEHFQAAAGITVHDPQQILVPGSGASTVVAGDEAESDLDLEYTSALAPGAAIKFVYTGNSTNSGAFDALRYVIENKVATIVSSSYGICETSLGSSDYGVLNGLLAQAATQGQSVISASGDSGSTDCSGDTTRTLAQQQALAVDFPASSEFVLGLGGTEFSADAVANANTTFWTAATTADVIGSAKSYIPEQVWNDDVAAGGLTSGGGGASTFTARPSFQTGVAGIPAGTKRLVPDVSLSSSGNNAAYIFCSSDNSTGVSGSCATGFRDGSGVNLTAGGGTSFAAPIFAGLLAIINQRFAPEGQGVVAAKLYPLAVSAPAAFHDVTSGSNACATSTGCSVAGAGSFSATVGYDQASGLGSIDFDRLVAAWPVAGPTLAASRLTLSAASSTISLNSNDAIAIAVSGSGAAPTGTVAVAVDGAAAATLTLSGAAASYSFSATTSGVHFVTATYSGDSNYASSSATISISVPAGKAFGLTAANANVVVGATAQSAITITPVNGYTGTVNWSVAAVPALSDGCFSIPAATVTGSTTAQLTIDTASPCGTLAAAALPAGHLAMFGFAVAGLFGLRKRRKWLAAALFIGSGFTACGGTSVDPAVRKVAGVYAVTITGTDSASALINASTGMTLTIR